MRCLDRVEARHIIDHLTHNLSAVSAAALKEERPAAGLLLLSPPRLFLFRSLFLSFKRTIQIVKSSWTREILLNGKAGRRRVGTLALRARIAGIRAAS
jgi:hypothetical protein